VKPVALAEARATELAKIDPIDELPLPYIEMDSHGVITRANRAALALHPPDRGELIGRSAWDLMAADEKDQSFAAFCSIIESGPRPGDELEVVHRSLCDRSGQFRAYQVHRSLLRDAAGNPAGMRMLFVDATDAKKALEEANRKSLWFQSVFDSLSEAVIVTDAVGFIRSVNPAAETLLGRQASELEGMLIEQGLPTLAYVSGFRLGLTFTMSLDGPSKGIASVLDRERRELHLELGTSPVFDKQSGATTGVVLVLHQLQLPG
jgi:PAS domain S-box-containing protein